MNTFYQNVNGAFVPANSADLIAVASKLAEDELVRRGPSNESPDSLEPAVKAFLAGKDHEFMCVAYLDVRLRVIEFKVVGEGSQLSVAPLIREIVRHGLNNAAMHVVAIHNHPGGVAHPSDNDIRSAYQQGIILTVFDMKLADSWVVAGDQIYKFSDHRDDVQERYDEIKKADAKKDRDPVDALMRLIAKGA